MKSIFIQEKSILRLTFNPRLALTVFRTIRPSMPKKANLCPGTACLLLDLLAFLQILQYMKLPFQLRQNMCINSCYKIGWPTLVGSWKLNDPPLSKDWKTDVPPPLYSSPPSNTSWSVLQGSNKAPTTPKLVTLTPSHHTVLSGFPILRDLWTYCNLHIVIPSRQRTKRALAHSPDGHFETSGSKNKKNPRILVLMTLYASLLVPRSRRLRKVKWVMERRFI